MTNAEAVNWLINLTADIGKAEHRDLWHYEQALYEIREMLEQDLHNDLHNAWQYHSAEDPPEDDRYILLEFENFSVPFVGYYECNENDGGAYYDGDNEKPLIDYGIRVRGWWELPEPLKEAKA